MLIVLLVASILTLGITPRVRVDERLASKIRPGMPPCDAVQQVGIAPQNFDGISDVQVVNDNMFWLPRTKTSESWVTLNGAVTIEYDRYNLGPVQKIEFIPSSMLKFDFTRKELLIDRYYNRLAYPFDSLSGKQSLAFAVSFAMFIVLMLLICRPTLLQLFEIALVFVSLALFASLFNVQFFNRNNSELPMAMASCILVFELALFFFVWRKSGVVAR